MGLGYSIEAMGNQIVGDENKHIVTEGLAVGAAYIALRYLLSSISRDLVGRGGVSISDSNQ